MHAAHHPHSCRAQRGAALLLAMFIIGLAVTALVMRSYDAAEMKARQEEKTMKALAEAKEALIAWSVTHPDTPGQMPWPDRRETSNPNYDGRSDCSNASFDLVNQQGEANFLGQLPSLPSTTPCLIYPGIGHYQDAYGNNLWYAVSRNLVRNYVSPASNPIINPRLLTNNKYPWMIVRDGQGNILSDRVAAVIIAPGRALSGQNRSSDTPPASAYLDTFGDYSNANYQVDDEDFIQASESDSFNDRLIYITVDELIVGLAKRVAREAKNIKFPVNGVIANCIRVGDCNLRDIQLTWNISKPYVTTGHPPVSDLDTSKKFRCTRKEFSLECDEVTESDSGIHLNIPLDDSYLGLMLNKTQTQQVQTNEKIRTVKAVIQTVKKNQEDHDVVVGSMFPTETSGILNIDIADVILGDEQVAVSNWYFENKWSDYTDINESPAFRKGTDCSSEVCFTITRKRGERLRNVRLLVTVRKDNVGVGGAKLPDFDEKISDFIAIHWEQ
ncbi:hypothetical protein ACW4YW_07475 [Methylobacillus pratensis]